MSTVLIGQSPRIASLRRAIERVARFPTTILLVGETGTGKSAVARSIHEASGRRAEPFVQVDCAGLLEAELYGVARGGFTGASQSRPGRFEAAGRGTLLLDEVGELAPAGQQKLLRALEEGTFERIGENRTRRLDARIIAATHVNLDRAVVEGRFRADLFYRLHVLRIEVPALRDRGEDFDAWLALAGARAAERLGCRPCVFSQQALARLRAHRWPGNLRELFHFVEAACVLSESREVDARLVGSILSSAGAAGADTTDRPPDAVHDFERAISGSGGNVSLAARELGVPRSTLRYRLGLDDALGRVRRKRAQRSE